MRALIALAMLLLAVPAHAEVCGPRDAILKRLTEVHKETRQGRGISQYGHLVEVFVNERGEWSILVTRPGASTCLVDIGHGWKPKPVKRETL